ncbi:formamidopyrimidine-DNA glycosylase [Pyrenochaeta sp. MPI-SDFR-AT-0127]|nr:formamidopyrimidine-DNA glycosylase [Pyrenochaeta sp. MPI-SDFR-AT-0127]
MPEIAEVARLVHYLKKHAVGKTVEAIKTQEDDIVYGKVGTSASAFQKAITGKKIIDARQQGKYFWLVMDSSPHPLMHLGMTGWIKFSNDESAYYRPKKAEQAEWPPRFWKFVLQLKEGPKSEVAFVDPRRLGRIRLVEADADEIRKTSPLKENGPDPVIDRDIFTVDWLIKKLRSKKVPVKALLLDQGCISGIGNWVGDEVLYQARLHPEQYSNTFNDEQVKRLHDAILNVCDTAIEANADSDLFPEDWLMKHRWSKGKKDGSKLPNGAKITFVKVGGRTSAMVPSVQKKTAAVAGDVSEGAVDDEEEEEPEDSKPKKNGKRKATAVKDEEVDLDAGEEKPAQPKRGRKKLEVKSEPEGAEEETAPKPKKQKITQEVSKKGKKAQKEDIKSEDTSGRRRSGRLSK